MTVTLLKRDCGLRLFNGPMTPSSSSPRMPTYACARNRRANTAARPSGNASNGATIPARELPADRGAGARGERGRADAVDAYDPDMDQAIHEVLEAADDSINTEHPPGFEWDALSARVDLLRPELERIADRPFDLDDEVQDASFFGDLAIYRMTEEEAGTRDVGSAVACSRRCSQCGSRTSERCSQRGASAAQSVFGRTDHGAAQGRDIGRVPLSYPRRHLTRRTAAPIRHSTERHGGRGYFDYFVPR